MKVESAAFGCAEWDPVGDNPSDRLAKRLLAGPMTVVVGLICLIQLLTWVPHYLTWPLWADHDVFATLARGWDAGLLPYRDLRCNQFPGEIYLFYGLGKLVGWGRSMPIYAFDVTAVIVLGMGLAFWSKRAFGQILPGIVGYLAFLSYYLELDFTQAAQRDWHTAFLAVLGVLILQIWRAGILGPAISGALLSMALSIRPQAAVFLPVVALQFLGEIRTSASPRRLASWVASFLLTTAAWILPLVVSGVLPDLVAGVVRNNAALQYRGLHAVTLLANALRQVDAFGIVAVAVATWMLPKPDRTQGWAAGVWLAALAFTLFYEPISPRFHSYLRIPFNLVFAMNIAVLAQFLATTRRIPSSFKLLSFLLVLGVSCKIRPEFCALKPSLKAASACLRGDPTDTPPPGYRRRPGHVYPWADYRAMLQYLRDFPSKGARIANVLKEYPAVVGLMDRLPAFPAESITWLGMVNPSDQACFAKALEDQPDSLVVWSPGEAGPDPSFKIDLIESTIRRLYEHDARFGAIEVWRRKGSPAHGPSLATQPSARPGVGG
jgi:hypothetical protein